LIYLLKNLAQRTVVWKYVKSIFKEIKTVGIIPIMSNTKFLVELPIQNTPTSKGHDISSTVPSNKLG